MGFIFFEGVSIDNIVEEISINTNSEYSTNPYIGGTGANTSYISETGKILTFNNLCLRNELGDDGEHRINEYLTLKETYKDKTGVLTSPSNAKLNGNYLITNFKITEDTNGNFDISWELTEQIPFNVTESTFRIWSNPTTTNTNNTTVKTTTKTTTTTTSGNSLSSNTKYLLKTCPLMSKGSNSTKCVRVLQKFLQSGGYYKGYKIDGIYGVYTVKELKKVQKKRSLKQTGAWDKNTRTYYRKKYNYP